MGQVLKEPLNKLAYERLLDMIVSGELAHGAQLDERDLAHRTGVSRTPLREAISRLAKEGVVEYFPYRGNFIRTWTVKQVNDLYAVRRALESLAVRLAVPKLSDEDIAAIEVILDDVQRALEAGDRDAFSEADRRFHYTIIHKTENEPLINLLEQLSVQICVISQFRQSRPARGRTHQ